MQVCFCQIYVFVQRRMFYTRTGRTACVYVERFRVSVTQHACACVLVCVFLWVPRTVPHQSQNKFRVPLGYRSLVLGLKVGKPKRVFSFFGYFEWSTWRANSTKRKSRRGLRHMQTLGAVLTYFGHRFLCLAFQVLLLLFVCMFV